MKLPTHRAYPSGGFALHEALREALRAIEQVYRESKVIIIGCLASWSIYHLRLGFVGFLLLLAVCRTYYDLSRRRIERAILDETRRYHAKHVLKHGETAEWMNTIIGRLWHLYQQRICDHIVRYVNRGLALRGGTGTGIDADTNGEGDALSQKVVIQSLALVEQPFRFLKFTTYTRSGSRNFIVEGQFQVDLAPPMDHRRLHLLHHEPLLDLMIVQDKTHDRKQHDLAVQVRQFTGTGVLRLEIDFEGAEPQILRPQIELQGQPQIDCTYRAVSQHHFPFHFAHHIDWRKVVEMQIREGLGWAFHRPLPLLHLMRGGLVIRMMTWWWQLKRACQD